MAESKGSLLAKSVQKHAGRAKEKVSALEKCVSRDQYGDGKCRGENFSGQ